MKLEIYLTVAVVFCFNFFDSVIATSKTYDVCSLALSEKECKFYNLKCSRKLNCYGKYSHECGAEHCAISRRACDHFIDRSILLRSISRPKMFKSQNRNYDKHKNSMRKCFEYDIALVKKINKMFI